MPSITIKKVISETFKVSKKDFESHGHWTENNVYISRMWRHIPSGEMFYEDCKSARDKNLNIYPFKIDNGGK
jgi:hypothetical protein